MDTLLTTDYVLLAVDYTQTRNISEHCKQYDRYETNMILGKCPSSNQVTTYFAASGLVTYLLADTLEPRYRTAFLIGLGILESSVVAHNLSIGIDLKF